MMLKDTFTGLRETIRSSSWLWFHVVVITLSTGIAWSLPAIAQAFLVQWTKLQHDHVFLLVLEVTVAVTLILACNFIGRSLSDRKLTRIAMEAGLVSFFPYHNRHAEKKIRELRERHGLGRTIFAIGSTGYGTFVDNEGEWHAILEKSLQANIMLMNPYSEEARLRALSLAQAGAEPPRFQEELAETLRLFKRLKAAGKVLRLKLYSDRPHVKMVILGDYLWLQHYHTGIDVKSVPEYVFQYNLKNHGLYTLFSQYFMKRWENPDIPEYDFDTGELVYRTKSGKELRREPFELETVHDPREAVEVAAPLAFHTTSVAGA
ncbi:MAG TPA: hypothetical protein VHF07_00475 [Nitrospiraceae bacterium]|nr:hypothetical protein [Nitrospiraceae bacterium]